MSDLLGLPGLTIAGPIVETVAKVTVPVAQTATPACTKCGASALMDKGNKPDLEVMDTPMRGKPVVLVQPRRKLICRDCRGSAYKRSDAFHPLKGMTKRLIRYIENAVVSRNLADVAQELALSDKQVSAIATDLIDRLQPPAPNFTKKPAKPTERREPHRFPQPDIVAMDGIQCNDKRFQVMSDGRTGRPFAISETWEADPAWKAMTRAIDVTKVRVFVTDMHVTNKSLAGTLHDKCAALHVADRFHVIHACNQAVSRVINHQVNQLRSRKRPEDATALLAMKARIEGKRTAEEKCAQSEFDFDEPPSIKKYKPVLAAHRARMQLINFYTSTDRETARRRLAEFARRASDELIVGRFEKVLKYIRDHEAQVLNYFDALEQDARGEFKGFDTSRAERRNYDIKDAWRDMRGGGFRLFMLRVLYHPYVMGSHIVEHDCGHFEGPLSEMEILARSAEPIVAGEISICPACAAAERQQTQTPLAA
jgi:transposase